MAMVIGLSGFSSMSAADSSLQTAGLMQAMASQQTAEAVELPAKLASAAYSAASDSVILKENTDPLKIHDQMTGETYNGQWLEFQVSVPEDGKYAFTARVQSPAGERPRMDVLVDMVHALTVEEGDPAGEGLPWMTTTPQELSLTQGEHTIRIAFNSDFELSWIDLALAVEPIEIRDGVQIPVMEYARISKDSVETESGDDPDVPGGLIPRYMMAGDWVEYRITVPDEQVGKYNLTMNVARAGTDPGLVGLQVYLDDNLAGQISRAGTGGWKSWVASDPLELDLSAGEHVIRVVYTAQCNMSLLEFTRAIQGDKKFTIDAVNYTDSSREFNTEEAQDPEVESGLIPAGTYNGDWLEYTFDVSAEMADAYYLTMHVARAGTAPGDIQMEATLDGEPVVNYVRAGTGGWKAWVETDPVVVRLTEGTHTLRVSFVKQFNLSLIKFSQEKTISDVIKVEASNFSRGSKNFGLEDCSDPEVAGGKNPTSTMAGDWLEYNLNIPQEIAGDFKFMAHVARATTEPDLVGMECYIDGELAAIINHDGTGGWQNWEETDPVGVHLEAGSHTVRIALTKQFNLSLLKFEKLEVDPDAQVTGVSIYTEEPRQAIKGKTTSFFATVQGDEGCDPFVTWEVEGATSAKISEYGLLSVSFGDPAESVTVRARSRSNPEIVSEDMVVPLIDESTEHGRLSREIAEEGVVLLKNDNEALPLKPETTVALLGIGQANYVKGGSGSGDVESPYVRTIQEGLLDKAANNKIRLYEPLSDFYSQYATRVGAGYGTDEPEMTGELVQLIDEAAAQENATAVVVLRRRTGEGSDIGIKAGEYYLRSREQELIRTALNKFDKVVVVMNIGVVMDMNWLNTVKSDDGKSVDAVFLAWQPGMEGGIAVANALCGEVNPSGKLTDTFVTSFDDYPSAYVYENSGRNAWVSYEEDIFVGYRYFETFAKEKVIFPFGYGLSYTTFAIDDVTAVANEEKGTIDVSATVTNTGDVAGKEVVQTYFSAPEGDLPKPALELAAFQKTDLLQPDESQTVTMSFDISDMSSYDDIGKTGKESAFVLEPGDYTILVGNSVRDVETAGVYTVDELTVTEQLTKVFQPVNDEKKLERRLDGTGPDSYETTVWSNEETTDVVEQASSAQPAATAASLTESTAKAANAPEEPILLEDVAEDPSLMTAFVEQLSDEQLILLSRGTGSDNPREIVDGANTACTKEILEYGVPRLQTADGPAGIRNNKYTATAWPCATLQACTWNPSLVEEAGKASAEEAKTFKTLDQYKDLSMGQDGFPILLTPSTNIHRNPMCGRNFEYYSEDPFIAGKMAAAQIRGIQSGDVSATLKHFSANNSENYRKNSDSMVSERAMREIYLRPFEIAVKEAQPWCVMSSYNLINGTRAAEDEDLLTEVLRNEWNFKGMVMTDWGSESTLVEEIKAGNDLKMPSCGSSDDPEGAPGSLQMQEVRDALADGSLSRKTLERNIRNTMRLILQTYFFDGDKEALEVYNPVDIVEASDAAAVTDFRFYYENEPVSLHVSPDVETISIQDANGQPVEFTKLAEGEYSFVMPASSVTVTVGEEAPAQSVALGLEAPETVAAGSEFEVKGTIGGLDTLERPVAGLQMIMTYPEGMTCTEVTPNEAIKDEMAYSIHDDVLEVNFGYISWDLDGGLPVDLDSLFTAKFTASADMAEGDYTFGLKDVMLSDWNGEEVPYTAEGASVHVTELPKEPQLLTVQWSGNASMSVEGEAEEIISTDAIYGAKVQPGEELTFTFTPTDGAFSGAQLNGEDIEFAADGCTYTFTMPNEGTTLRFTFTSVDKSILGAVLEQANAVPQDVIDGLVPEAKEIFENALAKAQEVYNDANATEAEVKEAWSDLLDAMHLLEFEAGDKETLLPLINIAEQLKDMLDQFKPGTTEGFEEALNAAKDVYAEENPLKADVDEAYDNLQAAIDKLEMRADMSILQNTVDEANGLDLNLYIDDEAMAAFKTVLAEAEELLLNADAAQADVDAKAVELSNAMAALRKIPNKDELNKLIAEMEQKDLDGYTDRSVAAFKAALSVAKTVAADANADEQAVAKAYTNLEAAANNLVKAEKPGTGNSGKGSTSANIGNAYGAAGVVSAAQGVTSQKAYVVSDTTVNFNLKRGSAYCFKMTVVNGNAMTPSFTVGNGEVLKTQFVAKIGNDYYYRVYAIGTPGQSTGVYTTLPGQNAVKHCTVTIA